MSVRWMQGARQLDTSRGSRFMREDAERPVELDTTTVSEPDTLRTRLDEISSSRQARAGLQQPPPQRQAL